MHHPVAAILVTYHTKARLAALCDVVLSQVQKIYIVDNGSSPELVSQLEIERNRDPGCIELILNAENIGLAAAQNQAIARALQAGFEWVLLLDDDSLPAPDMLDQMLGMCEATAEKIGIIAPEIIEQNVSEEAHYLVAQGPFGFKRETLAIGEIKRNVLSVIASGSLIHRRVFRDVGGMMEGYFIDSIDHELCLRARSHGYEIRVVEAAKLYHHQGAKQAHKLLGKTMISSHYSPFRRYHITRNRLWCLRTHGLKFPMFILHEILASFYDVFRILCFESQKHEKLQAFMRGCWHGLTKPCPQAPELFGKD
jgi:rhamnosyltransferase